MKFSIIICTLNRTKELEDLLTSLSNQLYSNFEILIVDQNYDDRVMTVIKKFPLLPIKHLVSDIGLSKARNVGLKQISGDIVCFPDDDCVYPKELLSNISLFFHENDYDILTGKTIDKKTQQIVAGKNITTIQQLTPSLLLGSSTTLFIRSKINIYFDEQFGLGSVFNAEEENELVFRLLKDGYKGFYNPDINYVYHPPSDLEYKDLYRARSRTVGLGAFIAKYFFTKEGIVYFVKYNLIRPLLGSFLYLIIFDFVKSKFYFNRFIGIWIGFIKYWKIRICK